MTADDVDAFAAILAGFAEQYNRVLSENLTEMFFTALAPYDLSSVQHAARRLLVELPRFPAPADFVRVIDGSPDDQARLAWDQAQNLAARAGQYRTVLFENGALALALRRQFKTWPAFCMAMLTEWHWKEFKTFYDYERLRPHDPMFLTGIVERENPTGAPFPERAYPTQDVGVLHRDGRVDFRQRSIDAVTGALIDLNLPRLLAGETEVLPALLDEGRSPPPADLAAGAGAPVAVLPFIQQAALPDDWGSMTEPERVDWREREAARRGALIPFGTPGIVDEAAPVLRLNQLGALRLQQRRAAARAGSLAPLDNRAMRPDTD